MTVQTIGHDKLNQLRHVRFFKDINGLHEHMKKHADILRPKFELVLATLDKELNGLGIGEWTKPHGGYFISFDSMEGCAKAIVAKAKEAGVVMTEQVQPIHMERTRKTAISVLHQVTQALRSLARQQRYLFSV